MANRKVLEILNNEREFIYRYSKGVDIDNWENLFNKIIIDIYKNSFLIESESNEREVVVERAIICTVDYLGENKIKEILNNLEINYSEETLYKDIKNNINKMIIGSEIDVPEELEEIIKSRLVKTRKNRYIGLGIILVLISSAGFTLMPHYAYNFTPLGGVFNMIHNRVFDKNENIQNIEVGNLINKIDSVKETIEFVHYMSNSIIIAANNNAKIGMLEVTPRNIDRAITAVEVNMGDKKLIKMLKKWQEGDFDNATSVHNYVWRKLNGQIGYAIAIDETKVNQVISIYYHD